MKRRRTVLAIVIVAVLVLSGLALAGALLIKSPQQQIANAKGPRPSVLTAQVQRRNLSQTVVVRGTVAGSRTQDVTPDTPEGSQPVITGLRVHPGGSVQAGSVLLEVAGRPLIALPGAIPAYRDMRPGTQGKDIAQLQSALRAVGEDPGEYDGYFGRGTKAAVSSLYGRLGYPDRTTGDADRQAVQAGQNTVRSAQRAVEDASDALALLRSRPPNDPAVAAASRSLFRAQQDLDSAEQDQADLIARSGTMMPLAEVVFLPSFPSRVEKLNGSIGAQVKAPLLTLSSGSLVVNASLNAAQQPLVKVGMSVQIVSEVLGSQAVGKVGRIGDLVTDPASGTTGYPLLVTSNTSLPAKFGGQDVRLTIQTARTAGPVLVVPISAVYAGADGRVSVLKQLSNGQTARIEVSAGVSGDGFVEVKPVSASLSPGDLVVVGS